MFFDRSDYDLCSTATGSFVAASLEVMIVVLILILISVTLLGVRG